MKSAALALAEREKSHHSPSCQRRVFFSNGDLQGGRWLQRG